MNGAKGGVSGTEEGVGVWPDGGEKEVLRRGERGEKLLWKINNETRRLNISTNITFLLE